METLAAESVTRRGFEKRTREAVQTQQNTTGTQQPLRGGTVATPW